MGLDKYYVRAHYICSGYMEPLTPAVFHILLSLADGEKHGYGIMLEVGRTTGGKVRLGPGTLYGTIQRLLKAGLIVESGEGADPALNSERRRYYRLTTRGRAAAEAEAQRLEALVHAARSKALLGHAWPAEEPA